MPIYSSSNKNINKQNSKLILLSEKLAVFYANSVLISDESQSGEDKNVCRDFTSLPNETFHCKLISSAKPDAMLTLTTDDEYFTNSHPSTPYLMNYTKNSTNSCQSSPFRHRKRCFPINHEENEDSCDPFLGDKNVSCHQKFPQSENFKKIKVSTEALNDSRRNIDMVLFSAFETNEKVQEIDELLQDLFNV